MTESYSLLYPYVKHAVLAAKYNERMDLSERVTYAIKKSGHSQAEVARRAGMTKSALNQIVKGTTKNFRMANLFNFSRVVGFNPEWIGTGYGTERPPKPLRGLSPSMVKLLEYWRQMDPDTKRMTMGQVALNTFKGAHMVRDGDDTDSFRSVLTEIDQIDYEDAD